MIAVFDATSPRHARLPLRERLPQRSPRAVLDRGARAGALAGGISGAIAGTLILPFVATLVGAAVGAAIGFTLGTVDAAVLSAIGGAVDNRPKAAMAAGVVAAITGWPLPAYVGLIAPVQFLFVGVCAVIGVLAGPGVVLGERPR